jgi:hypothetical protein
MNLRDAIAADILRPPTEAPALCRCFLCDRAFTEGRGHGINGRFCSALCLGAHGAGYVHREPKPPFDLPMRGDGFVITCHGCNREFVSKGLRCCSADCERKFKERQDIAATLAEIGEEAPARPKCEVCGANIPRWRNGRAVKKGTRFCSPKCSQKARRQSGASSPDLKAKRAQKGPSIGHSQGAAS